MPSQQELFKRFIAGKCTPAEIRLLLAQFSEAENELVLKQIILKYLEDTATGEAFDSIDLDHKKDELLKLIKAQIKKHQKPVLWPRIAIAASILLFLSIGTYTLFMRPFTVQQAAQNQLNDIQAGGNKALLTLANGQKVVLTDARNGLLSNQNDVSIIKTADGRVMYKKDTVTDNRVAAYNTITTPRGGQYQLTLADGTKVWLNSGSSLKYPAYFTGRERSVELTGEAYFEVAHNRAMPFRVASGVQTVQVLGTHFNINAYTDEPALKTTLLEGSVSITSNHRQTLLKPGQQATLAHQKFIVNETDIDDAVAWKNGMFQFSDESLESIMRKIARWYDVDIEYTNDAIKSLPLTGVITHYSNITKVLGMLKRTKQVDFKIDGRKIIVSK
ncbi:FecR family protein [Mucilaginibacter phyllosphaerae]|uniref:DUF4974 domain-containing protein n=1 Tax=Mucilaginibacter phyllosphaerae TaxID=1812349 RepID=A0A4Y8AK57_9SPHI|nr:FecR domain-containing protein [Mucilaginibacter phyllosphaerae]MBB3968072.1 hypothetical protein [Mucilaginibacter phyllosphaerae]TEW68905.1 DUF4974 domain-containing protein [Mucilaginibacter phyllosphaerae]GGH01432.1 iron dicitrate transporter FecR [Mucilaginibacter phyllosphaerae]